MAFITRSGRGWAITEKLRTPKDWRRKTLACLGPYDNTEDAVAGISEIVEGLREELAEAREVHRPRIGTPPGFQSLYAIKNDIQRWLDRLETIQQFVVRHGHLARYQRVAAQTKQKTKS